MNEPEVIQRGVSAIVQKVSTQALADGTTRAVVPLSIQVNEDTLPLIGKLMLNVKGMVTVAIVFTEQQGRLDLVEAPTETLLDHAKAQGINLVTVVGADGDTYIAHRFAESREDRLKCAVCDTGASHEIHSAQALELRERMRQEQAALAQAALDAPEAQDGTGNQVADTLIEEANRIEPADEAEAVQQKEAETALASRSRSK